VLPGSLKELPHELRGCTIVQCRLAETEPTLQDSVQEQMKALEVKWYEANSKRVRYLGEAGIMKCEVTIV
jgi:hypothetical protein